MTMTVGKLISMLEDLDENTEVRLAHQPSYEYSIASVVEVDSASNGYCENCEVAWEVHGTPLAIAVADELGNDVCGNPRPNPTTPIVYITEGTQLGYLPGYASLEIGWR